MAQFVPATAAWRGLSDPFDPLEAIAKSAKLLRDLRREFRNLWHVRVGADNRSAAEKLCAILRAAGVIYCEVQRN